KVIKILINCTTMTLAMIIGKYTVFNAGIRSPRTNGTPRVIRRIIEELTIYNSRIVNVSDMNCSTSITIRIIFTDYLISHELCIFNQDIIFSNIYRRRTYGTLRNIVSKGAVANLY